MNATIEEMETVRTPLVEVTPVIWRDGDMCGLASLRVVPTCPLAWLLGVIAMAM